MASSSAIDFRRLRAELREKKRRERAAAGKSSPAEGRSGDDAANAPSPSSKPRGGGASSSVGEPSWPLGPGQTDVVDRPAPAPPPPPAVDLPDHTDLIPSGHAVRPDILRSVYYVPAFLPDDWADRTLKFLRALPEHGGDGRSSSGGRWAEHDHLGRWTLLRHARRRVALFDASLDPSGRLPTPLRDVAEMLVRSGAFPSDEAAGIGPPNHVLVNEYRPGEGILPHTDGPAYESRTATISIGGGDAVLKFTRRRRSEEVRSDDGTVLEVLLSGSGSLVVFTDEAYIDHCHSIDEVAEERTSELCGNAAAGVVVRRGYRVSLTFRRKK